MLDGQGHQNGCVVRRSSKQLLKRSPSSQVHPTMNKTIFLLVFVCGVFVALFASLLRDYVSHSIKHGSGTPAAHLADVNYLGIEDSHEYFPFDTTQLAKKSKNDGVMSSGESNNAEALNSLNAALEMSKDKNKLDKAHKLLQHALALAPKNPIVLNQYGEFLEKNQRDWMQADHLFVRAITFSPPDSEEHIRALANRRRTAILVDEMDNAVLKRIDKKKDVFQKINLDSPALKRAKKEAYFQYVYHTVGIEGNTMTLAQTRSILETKLAVAGKSIMEHNEILGMDAALKYINQTLVDKIGDIELQDILEIHRRVIGNVDPVEAGVFRRTQVYVGDHVPPPPTLVELLINKLIVWFNSYTALSLHPVRLSALAHYKLVYIHPFHDGNGRTSRLLMNLVLMQAGYPPVIIRRADRELYYK